MFSSEFPRVPRRSRIPVIAGLIAVGGAGVYGYFQYQQYLQDRQAQVIGDEVKQLMTAPGPPLLADLPTKLPVKSEVTAEKPAETKEAEPDTPRPAPPTAKEPAQIKQTAPTTSKPVVFEENKASEATLTFPSPTATLVLPQVVAVEVPPAVSSQESQLSSLITDLQSSLEKAREEIKAEQSQRVSPR
jgi:hypothetical protein